MNTTALPNRATEEVDDERSTTEFGPVVGVRTTRIYCRPLCRPGRAPKPENCVAFADAKAARAAGYRPCKQCRPDDPEPPARLRTAVPETIRYGVGPVPIGFAFVAMTARGIRYLSILDTDDPTPSLKRLARENPGATLVADPSISKIIARIVAHLVEGESCDDLPLDLQGTPFQLKVWEAVRAIPHGKTVTYADLARSIGLPPGGARAVGTACGTNPVSLIVACHRVVRTGGGLGGYGWGLDRKQLLLDLEANAYPAAGRE